MLRSTPTALAGLRRTQRLTTAPRRLFSARAQTPRAFPRPSRLLLLVVPGALLAAACTTSIALDAPPPLPKAEDVVVDADTGIEFPRVLKIQSSTPLPPLTLVGVGVRTVSFLGIRVYSVGFYADLANPKLQIPVDATPEEKVEHIVRTSACLLRIVPTRSTGYTHLRDGFVRAMQARLAAARAAGSLTPEAEAAAQAPLRQLRTLFPNTSMAKGTALDIVLAPPEPGTADRALVFRDLGVVNDPWLSSEFVLAYFAGKGISPPMKKQVFAALEGFSR